MDVQYGNLGQLAWLWLVGACLLAALAAAIMQRRAMTRFATANLLRRVMPKRNNLRRNFSTLLVTGALSLMVLALVDIRWGKVWREVPQKGIEVVFLLDVSRSMLAEDAAPNRLDRAKQQIKDMVDEMTGDRVGLVVFAGDAKQQIPLTTHYDDFKQALDEVGPQNIRRGGSRLGDAIETASHTFLSKSNAHKAMVVFTDGEDQESKPLEAARRAHDSTGARIFTVGLGDIAQGARIPVSADNHKEFLKHDGQTVWSKQNGDILREVAGATDGAYIPAGTKQVDMAAVYHKYVESVEQASFETAHVNQYEARYQWFLAPALLLLLLEIALTTWPTRRVANVLPSEAHVATPATSLERMSHQTNDTVVAA
jgi:Ca-activated chloride channel family protein